MFKKTVILLVGVVVLSSCAGKLHRGVVAMKMNESTAHVGLSKGEAKVGEHVQLYANRCGSSGLDRTVSCEKVSKGHGVVSEIMNDNYVTVKFDSGVVFKEGDFIEKHSH